MRMELNVALLSSEGRLLKEVRQPSRSFVIHFIELLYTQHSDVDYSMKDISNTSRTVSARYWSNGQVAAKGGGIIEMLRASTPVLDQKNTCTSMGDGLGIQVGSNNTAPTPTDYAMNTRIAHGQGAGQLVYGGCEVEPPVVSAPNATMLIRRYFTNKSGGNVTVREVGMYAAGMVSQDYSYTFLICRDVIADIVVANTELLRVQYTLQVTV